MISPLYRAQVELLLRIIPSVAKEDCFALKGGTAINLFEGDMPRLSVDLDLTYLPAKDRRTDLKAIADALGRLQQNIIQAVSGSQVRVLPQSDGQEAKLLCSLGHAQVKMGMTTRPYQIWLWPLRSKNF